MERRRSVRFEIRLTCRLRKAGESGVVMSGTTLNVSSAGALIAIASTHGYDMPQSGDTVKVELLLPTNLRFGQRCIVCEGVAVRTEPGGRPGTLAVQFGRMMFREAEPAALPAVAAAVM